jgi:peptide/nickel transport system substrate-binding protein
VLSGVGVASASTVHPQVNRNGSLTVIVSAGPAASWPGLDPATDASDAADTDYLNAIYGELFEAGPKNQIEPDLATGYTYSNGNKTVTISLRKGVRFQDGTAFDAQAVASSINRDLLPSNACICDSSFTQVTSVTAKGRYDVQIQLRQPYSPLISAFIGAAPDWTISAAALASEGASTFGQDPVGAGPFKVQSDLASSKLVLVRNNAYWQRGHPELASLTFESIGSDESAYEALLAGQAGVAEEVTTIPLLTGARGQFDVVKLPAIQADALQLNTNVAPFNNIKAREAVYYATNASLIAKELFANLVKPTESPTGPGGLFYEPKVPGYRTYNLAKAKSLVAQLGGLSVTLISGATSSQAEQVQALATEWGQAGIKVSIRTLALPLLVASFEDNSWQAALQFPGSYDPAINLPLRFGTVGSFSGVKDPTLDGMLNQAAQFVNPTTRQKLYDEIFERISTEAYAPFLYTDQTFLIVAKDVTGIEGQETNVLWEDVAVK